MSFQTAAIYLLASLLPFSVAQAQEPTNGAPPIQDVLVRMLGEAQLTIARDEAQEKMLSAELQQSESLVASLQAQQKLLQQGCRQPSRERPQ